MAAGRQEDCGGGGTGWSVFEEESRQDPVLCVKLMMVGNFNIILPIDFCSSTQI